MIAIGLGTTAMGFCSMGDRLGSAQNTTKKTVYIYPRRNGGGVSGGKITKKVE